MYFTPSGTAHYIDLAAALTAVNRKQYHQTKNMKPLLYHVRAQMIDIDSSATKLSFATAPNTWTTRNAVTMLGAMYKKQLSNNGLSRRQLPVYGREMRLALETSAGYSHGSGSDGFQSATLADQLTPVTYGETSFFQDYTVTGLGSDATDDITVSYASSNDLTLFAIPETTADGEPETVVASLLGTTNHGNNDLAVVPEYLKSRRKADELSEIDVETVSDDSLLLRMGAGSDEHFDDIVKASELYGDQRPYNEAGAAKQIPVAAITAKGDYCSFVAPLGLMKVNTHADHSFFLTVTAITEM